MGCMCMWVCHMCVCMRVCDDISLYMSSCVYVRVRESLFVCVQRYV